ncbi:MAG: tol-pal system-associated acyl-CoA thioesterase [Thiohalomonadales bacterium]
MNEFTLPVRIYYEDTDCGGVVYHSNYLKFMERARTEWLRHLGLEQDMLATELGIIFAVRSVRVEFIKPAKFNQLLHVSAVVEKMAPASIYLYQKIMTEISGLSTLLCEAWVKIACITVGEFKPVRIPEVVKKEIMGGC